MRRSLYIELDAAERESLYCQHNCGPATTANAENKLCMHAHIHTTHRNRFPTANAIHLPYRAADIHRLNAACFLPQASEMYADSGAQQR